MINHTFCFEPLKLSQRRSCHHSCIQEAFEGKGKRKVYAKRRDKQRRRSSVKYNNIGERREFKESSREFKRERVQEREREEHQKKKKKKKKGNISINTSTCHPVIIYHIHSRHIHTYHPFAWSSNTAMMRFSGNRPVSSGLACRIMLNVIVLPSSTPRGTGATQS
jgi:hypothetical protein